RPPDRRRGMSAAGPALIPGSLRRLLARDRGAAETVLSNLLVALLVFLAGIILARGLGPEGRGRVAAHLVGITASFALGSLGINYGSALAAARSGGAGSVFRRIIVFGAASVFLTLVLELVIEKVVVGPSGGGEIGWALGGAAATQAASIALGWIQG